MIRVSAVRYSSGAGGETQGKGRLRGKVEIPQRGFPRGFRKSQMQFAVDRGSQ